VQQKNAFNLKWNYLTLKYIASKKNVFLQVIKIRNKQISTYSVSFFRSLENWLGNFWEGRFPSLLMPFQLYQQSGTFQSETWICWVDQLIQNFRIDRISMPSCPKLYASFSTQNKTRTIRLSDLYKHRNNKIFF
jgi:hypothetical protein